MSSSTGSELLAKIKVQGFNEFKITLNEAKHSVEMTAKAAQQYAQLMKHAGTGMNSFASSAGTVSSSLTGLVSTGFNPLIMALEAVGMATFGAAAGFFAFTKSAVTEAMSIQKLTATYAALSGGVGAAAQKIKFLQDYSKTSINQFDDLAEAGTLLEASGLRVERFVKSIDLLSGVFGGGKEKVLELSSAFGRLASGQMGESMEIFRRFGITAGDFMKEGLHMNGQGQLQATTEQALTAVEHIIKRKAGTFGDLVKDGLTLKFSNLHDAWNRLLEGFGKSWFPLVGRIVDSVTQFANFLNSGNFFQGLGAQFASVFDNLLGVGDGGGIQKFLAYLAAGVERLPDLLSAVGGAVKSFMGMLKDGIVWTFNAIGHTAENLMRFMNATLRREINTMRAIAGTVVNEAHRFGMFRDVDGDKLKVPLSSKQLGQQDFKFAPVKDFSELMGRGMDGLMNTLGAPFGAMGGNLNKRADDIFKQFQEYQKTPQAGVDGSQYGMFGDNYMQQINQIAQNTQKTATATAHMADLKKFSLGGGDLGQMGVTAAEMYGRGKGSIQVHGNEGMFKSWVHSVVSEALLQHERQRGPQGNTIIG